MSHKNGYLVLEVPAGGYISISDTHDPQRAPIRIYNHSKNRLETIHVGIRADRDFNIGRSDNEHRKPVHVKAQ